MRIGMTFNVRAESRAANPAGGTGQEAASDDSARHGRYAQWADDDEEFDAPETVQALAAVLESLGHEVDLLGEGEPMLRRLLGGDRPDLVLNFAEGSGAGRSREARVPAVLEMLDIPYTGSDPLTLAVTLDKDCAKRLVAASGVATPAWALFDGDESAVTAALDRVPFPWIVKPAYEGSSKGILTTNLIHDRSGARDTDRAAGALPSAGADRRIHRWRRVDRGPGWQSAPRGVGDHARFCRAAPHRASRSSTVWRSNAIGSIAFATNARRRSVPPMRPRFAPRRWRHGRRWAAATCRASISACVTAWRIFWKPIPCPACRPNRATWSCWPG